MARRERPLSPHLQVYRLPRTALLSITHRMTGVALSGGILILTFWLTSATYSAECFAWAQDIMGSWIGQIVLWGVLFSLYYHLGNGIRHMVWDSGAGFDLPTVHRSDYMVIAFPVIATAATLGCVYFVIGG